MITHSFSEGFLLFHDTKDLDRLPVGAGNDENCYYNIVDPSYSTIPGI